MNNNKCNIIAAILFSSLFLCQQICFSKITNISNNEYDNRNPSLYDGKIAWASNVDGDFDIYYWDGSTIRNISNNNTEDFEPSLYNGTIAWESWEDGGKIYYWDGKNTAVISNGYNACRHPSLYNGTIAFECSDGDDEVFYWDGSQVHKITDNDYHDKDPSLYDGKIAWSGSTGIYYWDGVKIYNITDNYYCCPSLYNGTIAFASYGKIFDWNGSYVRQVDITYGNFLSLFNQSIAYEGYPGILYWDGEKFSQVTNDSNASSPSLYNGTISFVSNIDGNNNIYFWDGNDFVITAHAGLDMKAKPGENVTIVGNATTLPGRKITDWRWEIKLRGSDIDYFDYGKSIIIHYAEKGIYDVTLVVGDDLGATASDSMVVTTQSDIPVGIKRYLPFLHLLLNGKL